MKVLYFGAEWCGPCNTLRPQIEKLCNEHNIQFTFINVDEDNELIDKYNVKNIPLMIALNDNDEVLIRGISFTGRSQLENLIKNNCNE